MCGHSCILSYLVFILSDLTIELSVHCGERRELQYVTFICSTRKGQYLNRWRALAGAAHHFGISLCVLVALCSCISSEDEKDDWMSESISVHKIWV